MSFLSDINDQDDDADYTVQYSHGESPTDIAIAADEPELELPGPRSIPVEIVNITEAVPNQAVTTQAFNVSYGDNPVQILNSDPLRAVAQVTAYGDGQIWLCHSKGAADLVAALMDTFQGVSELQSIAGVNPAPATGFAYVLPNPAKLLAVNFTFTADATALTRFLNVTILDQNNNVVAVANPASGVVASTNVTAHVAVGSATGLSASGGSFQAFPNLPELPQGWTVQIGSNGFGAADQFSNIHLLFEEGANAGPIGDDVPGIPLTSGVVIPISATAPVWAVASGDNMIVGVLQERRQ